MSRTAFIPGHPRPKGSLDAQQVRDGAGKLTGRVRLQDTPQSTRWRRTIAKHVRELGWAQIDGPCEVYATFWFSPAAVWPTTWHAQIGPDDLPIHPQIGDLDKLVRNVLDALTDAGVYADDRQVARVVADKVWARHELGQAAGLGLAVNPIGWPAP